MHDAATPQGILTYNYEPLSWHDPLKIKRKENLKKLRNWKYYITLSFIICFVYCIFVGTTWMELQTCYSVEMSSQDKIRARYYV